MSIEFMNIAVAAVMLVIWIGIFVYTFRIDRKVKDLEKK